MRTNPISIKEHQRVANVSHPKKMVFEHFFRVWPVFGCILCKEIQTYRGIVELCHAKTRPMPNGLLPDAPMDEEREKLQATKGGG